MSRRIVTADEQDAYTGWRRVMTWRPGERKAIKRRTHQRERREARYAEVVALNDLLQPSPDCRHGCGGGRWCSPACSFTCHDDRCENCTAPAGMWLGGGWFCSYECHAECRGD